MNTQGKQPNSTKNAYSCQESDMIFCEAPKWSMRNASGQGFQFIQVIIPIHVSRDRKIRADQGADARCINRDSWGWLEVTERAFRGPSAVMSPFCIPRARVTSYLETCRRWGCPPSAWSSLTPGSQTAEREREREGNVQRTTHHGGFANSRHTAVS